MNGSRPAPQDKRRVHRLESLGRLTALIVGFGFMEHGYAKLARGPDDFANTLHALGMPLPTLLAWATVGVEIVGGLAVFLGAYTPVVSLPMAVVLLVAIFTVHLPNGFSSIKLQ